MYAIQHYRYAHSVKLRALQNVRHARDPHLLHNLKAIGQELCGTVVSRAEAPAG